MPISANGACGDHRETGFDSGISGRNITVTGVWKSAITPEPMKYLLLLFASITALLPDPALSQEGGPDWGVDFQSFAIGTFAARTHSERPPGPEARNFLLAEERLRLELNLWTEVAEAEALVKLDGVHDAVTGDFYLDLREAYLDFTRGQADFRFGRQIATWGVGDFLFINDIFPKDWVSFFSGRPLEYLKLGVDALRGRYSSDAINAELMVIPRFEPDNLPTPKRFLLFDEFASTATRNQTRSDTGVDNPEVALRLYRRFRNYDVSAYMYRGYWRSPSQLIDDPGNPAEITQLFPALSTYGLSAQGQSLGGVISLEAGYYDSRDDRAGDNVSIPNSQARLLVGYRKQLAEDVTLGLQYYVEMMMDFTAYENSLPADGKRNRKYRDFATLSLSRFLQHQTWKLSLFAFYGPVEQDYLIQPRVAYRFSDNFSTVLGANFFGGRTRTSFFGQFDRNDNIYLTLRYDF